MKQNLSADLTFDLWQQPIGNGRRYCKIQYNDTGTGSYPLPVKVPSPVLLGVGARSRCRCNRHSETSNRIIHFIPQIRLTLHPNTLMAIFSLLHRRVQELKMVGTYWSHRSSYTQKHLLLDQDLKEILNISTTHLLVNSLTHHSAQSL